MWGVWLRMHVLVISRGVIRSEKALLLHQIKHFYSIPYICSILNIYL